MPYKKMTFKDLNEQNKDLWNNINLMQNLEFVKNRTILNIFKKYISKKDKIIEAGCGIGGWVYYMKSIGYEDIIGIDNNPDVLKTAKEYGIDLYYDDVLNTKYEDNTFDSYISLGVIEHNEAGPGQALNEAYRIIKPGGLAFISTPCNNLLRFMINHPIRDLINFYKAINGNQLYFSEYRFWKTELVRHISNAGFIVKDVVPNDFKLDQSNYSFGFYTDWPLFRHKIEKYRLNNVGSKVHSLLKMISPGFVISGYLVVAEKKK